MCFRRSPLRVPLQCSADPKSRLHSCPSDWALVGTVSYSFWIRDPGACYFTKTLVVWMNKWILSFRSWGIFSPSPLPHKTFKKESPTKTAQLWHGDDEGSTVMWVRTAPTSDSQGVGHIPGPGWNWPLWPNQSLSCSGSLQLVNISLMWGY